MPSPDRPRHTTGAVLGFLASLTAAMVLVTIRGEVDQAVVALVLAAVVSTCGALAGWQAGVVGAIGASLGFNFFHTQPYLSLRIHDADDVLTTVTLLAVGLVAGAAFHLAERRAGAAEEAGDEVRALERVIRTLSRGDAEDVQHAVEAELLSVLRLQACEWSTTVPSGVVVLSERGTTDEARRIYRRDGFELAPGGVAIPVADGDRVVGHLLCSPTPGAGISLARRRAAVTLAELLGVAMSLPAAGRQ